MDTQRHREVTRSFFALLLYFSFKQLNSGTIKVLSECHSNTNSKKDFQKILSQNTVDELQMCFARPSRRDFSHERHQDFIISMTYFSMIRNEFKEFTEFKTYLNDSTKDVDMNIRTYNPGDDVQRQKEVGTTVKEFNAKSFVVEQLSNSENLLGKTFFIGLKYNFFTRAELVEFCNEDISKITI